MNERLSFMRQMGCAAILLAVLAGFNPASAQMLRETEICRYGAGIEAIGACTRAIDSDELSPALLVVATFMRGAHSFTLRDVDGALADFDEVIRLDPNNAQAFNQRGLLRQSQEQYKQALPDFAQAIRLRPDYARAHFNRGLALYRLRLHEEAKASFDETVRLDAGDAAAFYNRAVVHRALQQYDLALADFDQAIRLQPDDARAHFNRGLTLRLQGLSRASIASFDEAIRLAPALAESAESYVARGNAQRTLGFYPQAMSDYEAAIKKAPRYVLTYYNRGLLWNELRDYARAIADFDEVIKLDADFSRAYLERGIARHYRKDFEAATADFDSAIRLTPDLPAAYFHRGNAREGMRDLDGAIANFTQALRLNPHMASAYNHRGQVWQSQNRFDLAVADYAEAARIAPDFALAHGRLAWALAAAPDAAVRNGTRALQAATRACELSDWNDAYFLGALASAYAESGDFAEAIRWQEKAIDLSERASDKSARRQVLASFRAGQPFRFEMRRRNFFQYWLDQEIGILQRIFR